MNIDIKVQVAPGKNPRIVVTNFTHRAQIAAKLDASPADVLHLAQGLDGLIREPVDLDEALRPIDWREDGPVATFVRAALGEVMQQASKEASTAIEASADKLKLSRDIARAVGV